MTSKFCPTVRLLLDSGAYTAWNSGESIDLKAYIKYIHEHLHLIQGAVNLDVIPGVPGKSRVQQDVEISARQSYENLQEMKVAGLRPMPVFHQGERFYWLEKLIGDGEDYIGISPMADLPVSTTRKWCDDVFTRITTEDGRPIIKTHGFGVTAFGLLFRYPWTSCDSATWALLAAYGKVMVPIYELGKPVFTKPPVNVIMSGVARAGASAQLEQFASLGPLQQDIVRRWLEDEVKISLTECVQDDGARRKANAYYYMQLSNHLPGVLFKHRMNKLSEGSGTIQSLTGSFDPQGVRIILATLSAAPGFSRILTELGMYDRLLSYYYLKDEVPGFVQHYVTTGFCLTVDSNLQRRPKWSNATWVKSRKLALFRRLAEVE